jgi:hypothetical protein
MNILFVTATRVGDAVLSTGLLHHLIERYPGARLTIAAEPVAAPLFEAVPRLERLIVVGRRRWALHWLPLYAAPRRTYCRRSVAAGNRPSQHRGHRLLRRLDFRSRCQRARRPALAAEIRSIVTHSTGSSHLVPIDDYIGDRLVRWEWGAFFGKSAHAALYRRGVKSWKDDRELHVSVTLTGKQGPDLNERLAHHVDRNISDMLIQLDRHKTLGAQDLRDRGEIGSFARNIRRIAPRFLKCYGGRGGYREGPYGFLIALCAALDPILSYLKARPEPGQPALEFPAAAALAIGKAHPAQTHGTCEREPPQGVTHCRSDEPPAE